MFILEWKPCLAQPQLLISISLYMMLTTHLPPRILEGLKYDLDFVSFIHLFCLSFCLNFYAVPVLLFPTYSSKPA